MLIGPGLFTFVFAQFIGPWRTLRIPGAPWYLAAVMYAGALVLAWRVTTRKDDVALPVPDSAPISYVDG
jgi:hypothetical protein